MALFELRSLACAIFHWKICLGFLAEDRIITTLTRIESLLSAAVDLRNLIFIRARISYSAESSFVSLEPQTTGSGQRPHYWTISGRVTDATSGESVGHFQLTPGNEGFLSQIQLEEPCRTQGVDGAYVVHLNRRFSLPVLKVEAEGYLPVLVKPPQEDGTDFDIILQPGAGPSGRVLSPDGKPAPNVTVALMCSGRYAVLDGARLRSGQRSNLVIRTDAEGHFAFPPELQMEQIVAASPDGFVMVSLAEFAANPDLRLEPWGRIQGVLKRPYGPGTHELLDLRLASETRLLRWSLDTGNHVLTDHEGRFEFERVPPGELQLTYRVKIDERKWRSVPLEPPLTVSPGQTLELLIDAPERKTSADFFIPQPKPLSKSGPPMTGVVLLPSGEAAAGAEVGLVVPNEYLRLLKASLQAGRDGSLKTTADANGYFALPGVEGITAIVAVNEDGFAKVSIDPGGQPARLALQPWGQISGTLRVGDRLGTNERVMLAPEAFEDRSFNYSDTFQARTDSQGRFVLTYVPPGEHRLCRVIPDGERSWHTGPPTMVEVKSGGVTNVTMGGIGRRVVGKAVPKDPSAAIGWSEVKVALLTSQYAAPKSMNTTEASEAWNESPEGQAARRNMRHYKTDISADGRFSFEDVDAGDYALTVSRERKIQFDRGTKHLVMGLGNKRVSIPAATGEDGANACDVGTVEVNLPAEFPDLPN
jgi:hypothetical protein